MSKPGSPEDEAALQRFEDLCDETPMSKAEVAEVLADAGLDPKKGLDKLLARLDQVETKERLQRFARAEAGRLAVLDGLAARRPQRTRAENLAKLAFYRREHPQLAANFRDFEHASDADVDSLVAEVEALIASGKKEP